MRWAILFLLISNVIWARPLLLVGYFDPFGRASFNNSERVAKGVQARLAHDVDVRLCPLNTVFAKAYGQFESCLKELPAAPVLALGLGEAGCKLKIELVARNKDKTKGPDNEGEERHNTVIIPEADAYIGMRYPLPQMYCALPKSDRDELVVSNNAGSFVCNNMAFQTTYYWPDIMFGFIHVPANNCRDLESKTEAAIERLSLMVQEGVRYIDTQFVMSPPVPHTSNGLRLPTTKNQLKAMRSQVKSDQCLREFFKRARGVDQKNLWSILD